ncbi:PilZ domain-containing protein [Thermodesulfobacteriota bacterium]
MSKKIKIFSVTKAPDSMENEINDWLQYNEDINILNFFSADLQIAESEFQTILILLYEEETKEGNRQHERINLMEIVDYSIDEQYFRDFIQDMSESGLFIRSSHSFTVGKEILMTFILPEQERAIKINGEIVRSLPDGIGVKFKKESQVQADVIRAIIDRIQGGKNFERE